MKTLLNRATIVFFIIVAFSYGAFHIAQTDWYYEKERSFMTFNQEQWLSAETGDLFAITSTGEPRRKMATDLTTNHLKIGMSLIQIESLIGKGDEEMENGNIIIYYLGYSKYQLSFSPDVLKITCSNNNSIQHLVYKS